MHGDYGVPQNRYRVFFVGMKNNHQFKFPEKFNYKITTYEALSDLPSLEDGITKTTYLYPATNPYQKKCAKNKRYYPTMNQLIIRMQQKYYFQNS